jgi:hypothetical protein
MDGSSSRAVVVGLKKDRDREVVLCGLSMECKYIFLTLICGCDMAGAVVAGSSQPLPLPKMDKRRFRLEL